MPEKLVRERIGTRLANVPPYLIGIEAGTATHYVARELLALGEDARQVRPAQAGSSKAQERLTIDELLPWNPGTESATALHRAAAWPRE